MRLITYCVAAVFFMAILPTAGHSQQSVEKRMLLLEETLKDLLDRDAAKDKEIARLKRALGNKRGAKTKAGHGGHSVSYTHLRAHETDS